MQHAVDQTRQQDDAVLTLLVDVGARVTAQQTGYVDGQQLARSGVTGDGTGHGEAHTTSAADGCDALFLGIQVNHGARRDQRLVQAGSTGQTGFLLGGEDALERRMCQRIVVQNCQHERNSCTVVAAQRGAVCGQHAVLDDQVNAVLLEVMVNTGQLLAYHVQMTLEHNSRLVLSACTCGLLDDDVVQRVLMIPQTALLSEGNQIVTDSLFVGRSARDCADVLKEVEQPLGLITGNLISHT